MFQCQDCAEADEQNRFHSVHREMRARRSAPSARLSLIENQDHTLNYDKRQLAKNEPLDSVNLARDRASAPRRRG